MIAEDREFDFMAIADAEQVQVQAGGGLDQNLFGQLKELRKKKLPKSTEFLLTPFYGSPA